jgi:hypothetical protein
MRVNEPRLSLVITSYPNNLCNLIVTKTVADMERAEGGSKKIETFAGVEGWR